MTSHLTENKNDKKNNSTLCVTCVWCSNGTKRRIVRRRDVIWVRSRQTKTKFISLNQEITTRFVSVILEKASELLVTGADGRRVHMEPCWPANSCLVVTAGVMKSRTNSDQPGNKFCILYIYIDEIQNGQLEKV